MPVCRPKLALSRLTQTSWARCAEHHLVPRYGCALRGVLPPDRCIVLRLKAACVPLPVDESGRLCGAEFTGGLRLSP